jgi:hypothetical protein
MKNKGKIPDFTEYGYVGNPIGPMHFFKDVILNECTDGEDILMIARFEIKKNALVALPSEVSGKRLISFARTIRGSSNSLELSDNPELHATHFVAYARIMVAGKWNWQQNDMQNLGATKTKTLREMRGELNENHHFTCVGLFLTRCVSPSSTIKRRQAINTLATLRNGTASQSSAIDLTGEDDTTTTTIDLTGKDDTAATPDRGVTLGRQTINLATLRNGTASPSSTINLTGVILRKRTEEERENDKTSSIAESTVA